MYDFGGYSYSEVSSSFVDDLKRVVKDSTRVKQGMLILIIGIIAIIMMASFDVTSSIFISALLICTQKMRNRWKTSRAIALSIRHVRRRMYPRPRLRLLCCAWM